MSRDTQDRIVIDERLLGDTFRSVFQPEVTQAIVQEDLKLRDAMKVMSRAPNLQNVLSELRSPGCFIGQDPILRMQCAQFLVDLTSYIGFANTLERYVVATVMVNNALEIGNNQEI